MHYQVTSSTSREQGSDASVVEGIHLGTSSKEVATAFDRTIAAYNMLYIERRWEGR